MNTQTSERVPGRTDGASRSVPLALTFFAAPRSVDCARSRLLRPGSTSEKDINVLATAEKPRAKPGTRERRARLSQEREQLSQERAERRAQDTRTYEELVSSQTLLDYHEAAEVIDRMPQSLRSSMMDRKKHIAEEGQPRWDDPPEPDGWRHKGHRREPRWKEGNWRRWAMRVGKLDLDGRTPLPYKPPGRGKGSPAKS